MPDCCGSGTDTRQSILWASSEGLQSLSAILAFHFRGDHASLLSNPMLPAFSRHCPDERSKRACHGQARRLRPSQAREVRTLSRGQDQGRLRRFLSVHLHELACRASHHARPARPPAPRFRCFCTTRRSCATRWTRLPPTSRPPEASGRLATTGKAVWTKPSATRMERRGFSLH